MLISPIFGSTHGTPSGSDPAALSGGDGQGPDTGHAQVVQLAPVDTMGLSAHDGSESHERVRNNQEQQRKSSTAASFSLRTCWNFPPGTSRFCSGQWSPWRIARARHQGAMGRAGERPRSLVGICTPGLRQQRSSGGNWKRGPRAQLCRGKRARLAGTAPWNQASASLFIWRIL